MDIYFLTRIPAAGLLCLVGLLASACGTAPQSQSVDVSAVAFVDQDGAQHQLAGEPTVLVFWQPWCGACREEAPDTVLAARRMADSLRFFGVVSGPDGSVDELDYITSIEELGLDYPQVRDRDLRLARLFDVRGTPTIVVLDGQGGVRYRGHHLPEDWSDLLGSRFQGPERSTP